MDGNCGTRALGDWSALVDPISCRLAAIHSPHVTPSRDLPKAHNHRISPSPPFSSPWPALAPKQRPRRRPHRRRQIIKVLVLCSAKGHCLLTLAGNRPRGIQPRKGSSPERANRRAERNRRRLTTPSPQVCLLSFVLYGSEVNFVSIRSTGACPEQRSQAQAINRTRIRRQPRPEATEIPFTSRRKHSWRADDWQRRPQTH